LLSASVPRLSTGPVIVLAASSVLVVSLLFAPRRGLVWSRLLERRVARRIRGENLLKDLYLCGERRGDDWTSPVPLPLLMGLRGQTARQLVRLAGSVSRSGLVERGTADLRLTPAGLAAAESVVRKHRLWETYLSRRLDLASDHLHRDADVMEHALTDETIALLEERLGFPPEDPHGRRIPRRRIA
jgi:manganese/zinc/iron transport system permease protein